MKTFRILPLLALVGGLTACPSEEPCFTGGVGSSTPPQVAFVDEVLELRINPPVQHACGALDGPSPQPTSLSVEIFGPDNQPVPSQVTFHPGLSRSSVIQFTPRQPGRHHVFAAFDPVGGIQQFDIHAARDRSAEAPLETLSQPCDSLERTQRGAWVCDSDVLRDGVFVQRFPGSRLAVAGDVVWMVGSSQVQRYEDTGTELRFTGTLNHSYGLPEHMLASPDELVVLYSATLQRITFNGTALVHGGASGWVSPPTSLTLPPGPRGLLVRNGDRLAILHRTERAFPSSLTNEACLYELVGERFQRSATPCFQFFGNVVGFEPDALWMSEGNIPSFPVSVSRLEWTGSALVQQAFLPLNFQVQLSSRPLMRRQTAVPVLLSNFSVGNARPRPTLPRYEPEQRTLLLEHLDSLVPDPMASPTLLWGLPAGGGTGANIHIRTRPTP